MTAEPTRDPAEEPKAPAVDAPVARPASAQSDAAAQAAALDAGALDAGAVDAPVADATTVDGAAVETPPVAVEAPAAPTRISRRPAIVAGLRRLMMLAVAVALFVGGVVLGSTIFERTRPAQLQVDGLITVSDPPPAVAQEFIGALGANDADAMRSSLNPQPNKDLTDEFTRFDIKRVTSVEVLGTSVDGTRSATEILLHAEKTDGLPFEVNLVILVDGGKIEGFR